MTGAPENLGVVVQPRTSATDADISSEAGQTSPARSDKSSDSEGRPVREKLKETRIDAQAAVDSVTSSDQPMKEISNGSAKLRDQSASGSDSERGRLRRKRSREDFEKDHEADKQPEKKVEDDVRHARKKSRDITKDIEAGLPTKPAPSTISRIDEADAEMTSPNKHTSGTTISEKASGVDSSPKNKRTRDQIEKDTDVTAEDSEGVHTNGKPVESVGEERDSKRLRDKDETKLATDAVESKTKIPPGSGFANTSLTSPFAAIASKSQAPKTSGKTETTPQTSDDKFKSSGFSAFSSSAASPFSALASPKTSSGSPFGAAASGNKLSSFAGSAVPSAPVGGGFGGFGVSSKLAFGGSPFGGSLGGGFGSLGGGFGSLSGAKPGLTSFSTSGTLEIKGLKSKADKPFGAAANGDVSDEDDGDESETEKDTTEEERRLSQPLLSQQPHETGEEGEITIWTGRAKLYTMSGEAKSRAWKERGTGPFKFNITVDEPKKARFVLRADGTHRLLLNAAVSKQMVFGGDAQGEKPKDGRLLFNEPTGDGVVEMHLLKLKAENAIKLWEEVGKVQELEL